VTRKPLWLNADGVRELLNLLVDRLDSTEQRGSGKSQSVALTEKTWPTLHASPFESRKEELWEHVLEMCRWGWLQVKPESSLKSASGYASTPRVTVLNELAVREAANRPERIKSSVERWRNAVDKGLDGSNAVKRSVGEFCIDMPDHSMGEVVQQLNRLPSFVDQQLLLREVSAQIFWGMSKVLDKRQGLVAAMMNLDECPFPESPVQLQVYLPVRGYADILFIENLMTFEQACSATDKIFSGLALVYASGFKGSAKRLRKSGGCSIFYAGAGALGGEVQKHFEDWLFCNADAGCSEHFWGDLDYSGMRILAALRSTFPKLTAWEAGYSVMLNELLDGRGHSPEAAEKVGQKSIDKTGCLYADLQLIPAIKKQGRFVDQELYRIGVL
jgi:Uncharacterized protein conserved in bacteria C-term(DUF2220)